MALMKSAILVCVTAVATVLVPSLWTERLPVITGGTVEPGFELVAQRFRENFENGVEYATGGSAYSVYYKGSKVVDIWGGYADSEARRPWTEDTISIFFSTTKGIAALCIATLVDKGLLDYDKTVASYWPEFAQNGKENVTVRMLVNHQAGLSYTSEVINLALLADQDALGQVLARSPPMWEPGTAHGYHALTFGLYLSQLLRRVDPKQRTLGQYFKEEIAEPFGVDFQIGLPLESFHRVARLQGSGTNLIHNLIFGMRSHYNRQLLWSRIFEEIDIATVLEMSGDMIAPGAYLRPETLALEQPSAYGVGTARSVAKVYGILSDGGASTEGQRLLSSALIGKIIGEAEAPSRDRSMGLETSVNMGFFVDDPKSFGHPGAGGMQGEAFPGRRVGVGYVSGYSSPFGLGDDPRYLSLREATFKCIDSLEI